jgi:hypothetical protein
MPLIPPTEHELHQLFHYAVGYDPIKAKQYYERTKQLKGRQRGSSEDPRTGKTREEIAKGARTRQRKELTERINSLSKKLDKLEALIKERESKEKSEDRKGKAKKERAAKEAAKPDSAAEKAEAARESEKYRDKNQQKLKGDDKKSGGGSGKGDVKKTGKKKSVSELRSMATKVKGQIAVAKQKLAAL